MYAIVRDNRYDPDKLAWSQAQLEAFQLLHARQPGFRGSIVVDAGNGRWLTINLWESQEHAAAALPALVPDVQRLLEPLMAGPSQVIGAGAVVQADLPRT